MIIKLHHEDSINGRLFRLGATFTHIRGLYGNTPYETAWIPKSGTAHRIRTLLNEEERRKNMPIILWLLGLPLSLIIVLWLLHVI